MAILFGRAHGELNFFVFNLNFFQNTPGPQQSIVITDSRTASLLALPTLDLLERLPVCRAHPKSRVGRY